MSEEDGAAGGNPDDPQAGTFNVAAVPVASLTDLDEGTREWLVKRHAGEGEGNIDLTKLAKQAAELDKFAGKALVVPKDDATEEEWSTFYNRLGRPEAAEGYAFKPPEGLPENVPYDQKAADWFRGIAHEVGLTPKQAAEIHDKFVPYMAEAVQGQQASISADVEKIVTKANETLVEAWGPKDGEQFKANVELAGAALTKFDTDGSLKQSLVDAGFVGPAGEVLVGPLAVALSNIGKAMLVEGDTLTEVGGAAGENPFEGDVDLTAVMALVKRDKGVARQMAVAAGVNPADYGL